MTTRERIEAVVLEAFELDYEPDAHDVVEALIDEDVSRGEYEGCSVELELAYTEYMAEAERVLA